MPCAITSPIIVEAMRGLANTYAKEHLCEQLIESFLLHRCTAELYVGHVDIEN